MIASLRHRHALPAINFLSPVNRHSIKPPEVRPGWPILQLLRRHIHGLEVDALLAVAVLIVDHHPSAKQAGEDDTKAAKRCCGGESRDVLGRILVKEDVGGDDAHEVGEGDGDGGEDDATVLEWMGGLVHVGQRDRTVWKNRGRD